MINCFFLGEKSVQDVHLRGDTVEENKEKIIDIGKNKVCIETEKNKPDFQDAPINEKGMGEMKASIVFHVCYHCETFHTDTAIRIDIF